MRFFKVIPKPEIQLFGLSIGVVALAHLFYYVFIGPPVWGVNDDVGISMILSGVWSATEPSGDSLYVNFLLGNVIAFLYKNAPNITWYPITLLISQGIAFSLLLYSVLRKEYSWFNVFIGGLLVFTCLQPCLWYLQFTIVSSLCCLAGIMLFYSVIQQPSKSLKSTILILLIAASMVILGVLIRYHTILLITAFCLPISFICSLFWFVSSTKKRQTLILALSWIFIVTSSVITVRTLDNEHYKNNKLWAEWFELNIVKSQFTDYDNLKYNDETKDLYKKIGWNKNDLQLIDTWQYLDPEVFTLEKFIKAYNTLSAWRGIENLDKTLDYDYLFDFQLVWRDILEYLKNTSFIPWIGLMLIVLTFHNWKSRLSTFALIAGFIGISVYLIFGIERAPFRILIELWLGLLWFLFYIKAFNSDNSRLLNRNFFSKLGIVFVLLCGSIENIIADIDNAKELTDEAIYKQGILRNDIKQWANALPEGAVLYMVGSTFNHVHQLPLNTFNYWKQIPYVINVGWGNHSYHQKLLLKEMGLYPHFYKGIIRKENGYVLLRENPYDSNFEMNILRKYFRQYHQKELKLDRYKGISRLSKLNLSDSILPDSVNVNILDYLKDIDK